MEDLYLYVGLFIVLELFEVWWQKAPTLYGVIEKIYHQYRKSVFLVFFLHPTLYLSIYLLLVSQYNLYIQILFSLKISDIALKLLFVKKIFFDQKVPAELDATLRMPIEPYMLYAGVFFYPVLIVLGV